ncbi:MAG: hypothetical protein IJ497_07390 [Clostridia bacterium]|nr:hypothetical protein [Clostridia bacterium]MBQ8512419.1 hypothetical protein [Clostridia bacterium]
MNKKLISLFLAMMMVLGIFTGCSSSATEEDVEATADTEESARISMTLSLWAPTEAGTTDEAIEAVEAAMNKLTQAKYDTAIELHLLPRETYWETVSAKLEEIRVAIEEEELAAEQRRKELRAAKARGESVPEETEETTETVAEEETVVNDLGITIIQYPEVGDKQLDIFLVTSYEDYYNLIENEQIQQLDSELSGNSKILKTYIYPTYLQLANMGGTYGIPNNHPVGECQYLLVNKQLVADYYYDAKTLSSLLKCEDFITDIGNQNLEGVTPLLGEVEPINMSYWSEDGEWSLIASQTTNSMDYNIQNTPKSIFSIGAYVNTIGMMKRLNALGYVGDGVVDEGEKFAVGVIKGTPDIVEQYEEEYYTYVYAKPVFTEEDIFGSMFAVSSYSKSLTRSMEIITYLNTSSDIRTIFQYGAEGIHWEYDDEDTKETITILSDDYQMNIVDTGNVYMTYPGEGQPMSDWEPYKLQNLESTASPFIGMPDMIDESNEADMQEIAKLSKEYKARMEALTAEEWDEGIDLIKDEIKANTIIQNHIAQRSEAENGLIVKYKEWFQETYPQ